MKQIKFIHTADWHLDSDEKKKNKAIDSLDQLVKYCEKNKVDAIIHSGDMWERKQSYSKSSGVPYGIEYLRRLSKLVDFIFITTGNASHDEPGSISLLHQLEENIYAYEYPVCLAVYDGGFVTDLLRLDISHIDNPNYIISLIPYPTKASFIQEDSIDNNNADFIEKFEEVFELIGDKTSEDICPKLLAFHGNVQGSRLSTGQTLISQDIMVAPSTLEKAKADYYALGHIHLRQEIKWNMVYSGSIYNKNWGETEQKSFEVVEFNHCPIVGKPFEMKTETIPLTSARPMVKIEAEYQGGTFMTEAGDLFDYVVNDEEFRIRIMVNENDRKLITEDSIQEIKNCFGEDVKFDFNIIPDERESRSEQIMKCNTLMDEVEEYAKVTEVKLPASIKEKVSALQNESVFV